MTRTMGFEQARQTAIAKWDRLAGAIGALDPGEFRRQLLEPCGFCTNAQAEIDALGVPKVTMVTCDFCRAYLDHGGCRDQMDVIVSALDVGDWDRVRSEIETVRGFLGRMAGAVQ